jgi:methionine biosynthesis protein MetW
MRQNMPSGSRVLDVGCGTGSLTLIVNHDKRNEVIAIEPDPQRAEEARRRGLKVVAAELDDAFLAKNGPFDVIIFADVLEHLASPRALLDLAVRGLSPGGLVLISVPNGAHWSVRASLLFGRFDYEPVGIMDATHLRWFTARSLKQFVEGAGLKIIGIRAAAGVNLPVYGRFGFRFVSFRLRRPVVRLASKLMPRLFASQFVVIAEKITEAGTPV